SLRYPDPILEKKNDDLHNLLKSVPKSDYVIDVFSCALQRDIAIQGKIFVTQNRICFHSNILGFVTVLVINLKDVTNIARKNTAFYSSILVTAGDTTHTFKTFLKDDLRTFGTLKAIWLNATDGSQPLNVQELFDSIYTSYHKNGAADSPNLGASSSPGVAGPGGRSIVPKKSVDTMGGESVLGDDSGKEDTKEKEKEQEKEESKAPANPYDLPPNITPPAGEASCQCTEHLERKEIDVVLPVPCKKLFDLLFGGNPDNQMFWEKYHTKRGDSNLVLGPWNVGADPVRENKFVVPVNNPMVKIKEADCFETMHLLKKQEWLVYVVEIRNQTPQVTYGDAFSVITRYCITWVSKDSCRLGLSIGLKWFKSPMVKNIIKGVAMKTLQESAAEACNVIRAEVDAYNRSKGGAASKPKANGKVPASASTPSANASPDMGLQRKEAVTSTGVASSAPVNQSNLSGQMKGSVVQGTTTAPQQAGGVLGVLSGSSTMYLMIFVLIFSVVANLYTWSMVSRASEAAMLMSERGPAFGNGSCMPLGGRRSRAPDGYRSIFGWDYNTQDLSMVCMKFWERGANDWMNELRLDGGEAYEKR
ncbi:hypothetical protein HK102_008300, partial [Quaeritorhiza haematococci]